MEVKPPLPDTMKSRHKAPAFALRHVGMEGIAVPVIIPNTTAADMHVNATADLFVGLDKPFTRGIHMSRLYRELVNTLAQRPITGETLSDFNRILCDSQDGLSETSSVCLKFKLPVKKPALISSMYGYQHYPISIHSQANSEATKTTISLEVPYSSTCPCSAELSRQAMSDAVDQTFPGEMLEKRDILTWLSSEAGSVATPHSQRSFAYITMELNNNVIPDLLLLIQSVENALGTPLQTAVRRQDEQSFAKRNARNLMFCEDAGRKVKQLLEDRTDLSDYWFKIEHQESLHAHNAVVIDYKKDPHARPI